MFSTGTSEPGNAQFRTADWQVWFHALRRTLMESQCNSGCSAGSWRLDPAGTRAWSSRGGRLMATDFAVQLLELEYGATAGLCTDPDEPVRAAAQDQPPKR